VVVSDVAVLSFYGVRRRGRVPFRNAFQGASAFDGCVLGGVSLWLSDLFIARDVLAIPSVLSHPLIVGHQMSAFHNAGIILWVLFFGG
jgi:hypothetical protein